MHTASHPQAPTSRSASPPPALGVQIVGACLATGLLLTAGAPLLHAGEPHRTPHTPPAAVAPSDDCPCAAPHARGELAAFFKDFDHVSNKLRELAGEFAAADYAYRPTDEVRSVGETFVHLALANYWLASTLGSDLPDGFDQGLESTLTEPREVVAFYKASVKQAFQAVKALDVDTLDQPVEGMGPKQTRRDILAILTAHSHEHLGQLAVYLRLRGGVPPWTAREGGE